MAGKTFYQSDRCLSLLLGTTVTGAAATYVNLFVTNPTGDSLDGAEWEADRVQVHQVDPGNGEPYWSGLKSDGNLRFVDNVLTISWTMAVGYTADETVVGIGVWDASEPGLEDHLLYWEALDINRTIAPLEEIAFGTGALKVRED